ncbi:MAG: type IV secretion system DNA-binding domain-containing protein [Betaproteobacteria bacterium]
MSLRAKNDTDFYVRGSEIWHHKLAMFMKASGWVVMAGVSAFMAVLYTWLFVFYSATERAVFWYYRIASAETLLGFGNSIVFVRRLMLPGVDAVNLTPSAMMGVTGELYADKFGYSCGGAFLVGAIAAFFAARYITRFYEGYGKDKSEREHLRGTSLVTPEELTGLVSAAEHGLSPYTLAGVPLPKVALMRNIFAVGAMGIGKSELFFDLAEQVMVKNGRKSIVWDKTGELTRLFYRPEKDVILNPFDKRYPGWNIFSEVATSYGFDQLAHSLCPDPEKPSANSVFFAEATRTVLASGMQQLWAQGKRTTTEFANALLMSSPAELNELLQGTDASKYVSLEGSDQTAGVYGSLMKAVRFLKYVPNGDFSVTEWVQRDDDSRLFITSHETAHDILLPLVSAYIDIAVRATMGRSKTFEDRLWIWLDEMDSLGHISILKTSLTQARKYGVVHVVGLQNVSQLRSIYGQDNAQTLRSNLQNYVVCRVSDEESQEAFSKLLGTAEYDEQREGLSFGVAPSRDGGSLNIDRKETRIVLPSQIKMLPDNTGYMQIAGAYPIAKVTWPKVARKYVAEPYLMRNDLLLANQEAKPTEQQETEDENDDLVVRF